MALRLAADHDGPRPAKQPYRAVSEPDRDCPQGRHWHPAPVALQADATPLAPRITQSAEAAGIPLARLDPEGAQLRVTVAKVGYAEASAWIASLEARDGVRVLAIEMSRLTEPGQITLRMTLEDAR
ncbi:type II secretion system protein GspM [Sulfitobacter pacificus]|uniref:type II secretion system protein GspM n=1 Tax=Sulfitobacter pacificus TaxID=1499314 RepID=UPI0036107CEA